MIGMKGIRIGLTTGFKSNNESIWTNGIKQNILNLHYLLSNSDNRYQVSLLNNKNIDWSIKPNYLEGIDIFNFDEKYLEMDLIIVIGSQIEESKMKKFKLSGKYKKIISYKCGNDYIVEAQKLIFDSDNSPIHIETYFDEIWYIPQQHELNYGFYKTLNRTKSIMVPFIWHNKNLINSILEIDKQFIEGKMKKNHKYDINKKSKTIGVMEPNIDIIKLCLIPILIVEESYRNKISKDHIEKLIVTNADSLSKDLRFKSIISTLDIFKDKKIFFDKRFQTSYIVTQFLDIIVSHQLMNPLNYLYLDIAYMGYPILHNASLCKDIGYYYKDSDTEDGSKMLNWILENHDKNIDEYKKRNSEALAKYHADNDDLIKDYDMLIYNIWNGDNEKLIYNSKSNSFLFE